MRRSSLALPILASLTITALFVAANVAESENPLANYEASEYTHYGFPWAAVIEGEGIAETHYDWGCAAMIESDGYAERAALKVQTPAGQVVVFWRALINDLLFALALQAPVVGWVLARRRGPRLTQFHLRTALILALVGGTLLGVNVCPRAYDYYGAPAQDGKVESFSRGWPCDGMREWPNRASGESFVVVQKFGIAFDVLAAALLLVSTVLVSEVCSERFCIRIFLARVSN